MMTSTWLWGELPEAFKRVDLLPPARIAVVRRDVEASISVDALFAQGETMSEDSRFVGRARLGLVRLANGEEALLRPYRHGGLLRGLTRGLFWTWPPRPLKELAVTEAARRRGVATAEIVAALVERVIGPLYRGWLVIRVLEGARDLWSALHGHEFAAAGKSAMIRAAAQAVREMHRKGVYHRDLNLKNILIRAEGGGLKAYVIDLDKAMLFPREVPARKARANLARLHRSVCKLDPQRLSLSAADWESLIRCYQSAAPA
jgi:hypothetical protein